MIAAVASIQKKDRGLGFQNELLVKMSSDLKRFKEITSGHPVIMGRKTFESIGKALPNRTNIVVTRNEDWNAPEVIRASAIKEAIEKAKEIDREIFIIGGGEIYKAALPYTDRLYLTLVDSDKPADAFFPDYSEFTKVIEQETLTDEKTGVQYENLTLDR